MGAICNLFVLQLETVKTDARGLTTEDDFYRIRRVGEQDNNRFTGDRDFFESGYYEAWRGYSDLVMVIQISNQHHES